MIVYSIMNSQKYEFVHICILIINVYLCVNLYIYIYIFVLYCRYFMMIIYQWPGCNHG